MCEESEPLDDVSEDGGDCNDTTNDAGSMVLISRLGEGGTSEKRDTKYIETNSYLSLIHI